ncbi:MAG TPA: pantoate--beta-alanine ligase [Cytophagaceae bacterium]|jgi:pantoate--beta-alanine ligase|nr:pantoate--beta-alanine ligase [Cytophagaceae bacterium]
MELLKTVAEARKYCFSVQKEGFQTGLVPTMGALHEGHLSLISISAKENKITLASIFVNPIQFNNPADLAKYPRTLEQDLTMLEKAGCQAVFAPDEQEMYASKPLVKMDFGPLENVMEGAFRPGHFSGVGVVVSKLFNILQPTRAYFGQKDLQQFLVIQQMVKDLSFPILLTCCPIIREPDGLAMSSRNVRLSPQNRPVAAKIYESLRLAASLLPKEGVEKTKKTVAGFLDSYKELQLEYFEIADGTTLEPIEDPSNHKKVALCIAVFLDGVRLIDNLIIE